MSLTRIAFVPLFLITLSLCGCHHAEPTLPGTAHPAYTITDLGVGMPKDVNNQGQVVGMFPAGIFPNSKGFPYFHGCLWDKGKRIEMLTLGGWYSQADSINDKGQILGTATVAGLGRPSVSVTHNGLWDGHKLTDLESDPRFHGTRAIHITKSGAVYVVSPPQGPQKQLHLWLYPAGFGPGIRRDMGVIGGPKIKPMFINDKGMVAGTWDTGEVRNRGAANQTTASRTFVWHRGDKKWIDLGTLGGARSEPSGLNNADEVIGHADVDGPDVPRTRTNAFLWKRGKMLDLGTLPGGYFSHPNAINSQGQVVGYCAVDGNGMNFRPVLWEHGQIKDLTQFIPRGTRWGMMESAAGINDRGQIVGQGAIQNDKWVHGYLLTPR